MFINGDVNWVNMVNDAVVTYNNNIHSTIYMTPVDTSNNTDKVKYSFIYMILNLNLKGYTSKWSRELFKVNDVLKTQPPTYKIEDINGEIIEGKYYEQELLKSEFDFESNNKVLESLNIYIPVSKYKNDKK